VVRFKNPLHAEVVFDDRILGEIRVANSQLDDLIIARSDGTPTYNFTVVVDDMQMRITHVIRGNDHVNNTPRQINLFDALGGQRPVFAHVPMIHGADGRKLSKRHGAVSVMQFRDDGYLSDGLINYLARLGWSHGDQEIFSRAELIELFDIVDVNNAASVFDAEKLGWLNQHYIKQARAEDLLGEFSEQLIRLGGEWSNGPPLEVAIDVQRERSKTLFEMARKSMFAFHDFGAYDEKAARKFLTAASGPLLASLRARLAEVAEWTAPVLDGAVRDSAEASEVKLGALAQPLRVALTGSAASPPIDQTLLLVGKTRSLERIDRALRHLG
jgi:glutamyl-tRNA synthetase